MKLGRSDPARVRFEALVERHEATVLRITRAVLRDEHLAFDAGQEALLRLWKRMAAGGAEELREPAAWLRRAALSSALDLARRRDARGGERSAADAAEPLDRAAAPAADAALAELRAELEACVQALPEGQRTVFRLKHEGGLSLSEVAATLGVSLSTAKTHFARAAVRLQTQLSAHDQRRGTDQ